MRVRVPCAVCGRKYLLAEDRSADEPYTCPRCAATGMAGTAAAGTPAVAVSDTPPSGLAAAAPPAATPTGEEPPAHQAPQQSTPTAPSRPTDGGGQTQTAAPSSPTAAEPAPRAAAGGPGERPPETTSAPPPSTVADKLAALDVDHPFVEESPVQNSPQRSETSDTKHAAPVSGKPAAGAAQKSHLAGTSDRTHAAPAVDKPRPGAATSKAAPAAADKPRPAASPEKTHAAPAADTPRPGAATGKAAPAAAGKPRPAGTPDRTHAAPATDKARPGAVAGKTAPAAAGRPHPAGSPDKTRAAPAADKPRAGAATGKSTGASAEAAPARAAAVPRTVLAVAGGAGVLLLVLLVVVLTRSRTPEPPPPPPPPPPSVTVPAGKYRLRFTTVWSAGPGPGCEAVLDTEDDLLEVQETNASWTIRFFGQEWKGSGSELAGLKVRVSLADAVSAIGSPNPWTERADGELVLACADGKLAVQAAGVRAHQLDAGTANSVQEGFRKYEVTLLPPGTNAPTGPTMNSEDLRPGEIVRLVGHRSPLGSLEPSADGKYLLSSDEAGVVCYWPLAGEASPVLLTVPELRQSPAGLRLLPDGKTVLSAGGQGPGAMFQLWTLDGSGAARGLPVLEFVEAIEPQFKQALREQLSFEELAVSADGRSALLAVRTPHGSRLVTSWDLGAAKPMRQFLNARSGGILVLSAIRGRAVAADQMHALNQGWGWNTVANRFSGGTPMSAAFSAQGTGVAMGSADGSILCWDDTRPSIQLRGPASAPVALAFSPDGRRLASASLDGTTRIWDLETGRETNRFRWADPSPSAAEKPPPDQPSAGESPPPSMSMPGMSAASGAAGKGATAPFAASRPALRVAFAPDGKRLFSSAPTGSIHVWDLEAAATVVLPLVRKLPSPALPAGATILAQSPDGRHALVPGISGTGRSRRPNLQLWDLETNQKVRTFEDPNANATGGSQLTAVAFSPGGQLVATRHAYAPPHSGRVWLWSIDDDKPLRGVRDEELSDTPAVPTSPATARREEVEELSDTPARGTPEPSYPPGMAPPARVAPAPSYPPVMETPAPAHPQELFDPHRPSPRLAFTPDERHLVVSGSEVYFLETQTLRRVRRFPAVSCLDFSADGRLFVGQSPTNSNRSTPELSVYEIETGRASHTPFLQHVRFTPNGRYLVGTKAPDAAMPPGSPNVIRLVSVDNGEVVRAFGVPPGMVKQTAMSGSEGAPPVGFTSLSVAPDGRLLAAGCYDGTVVLLDVESGRRLSSATRLPDAIQHLDFGRGGLSLSVITRPPAAAQAVGGGPRYLLEWPDTDTLRQPVDQDASSPAESLVKIDFGSAALRPAAAPAAAGKPAQAGDPLVQVRAVAWTAPSERLLPLPDGATAILRGADRRLCLLSLESLAPQRSCEMTEGLDWYWSDGRELLAFRPAVQQGPALAHLGMGDHGYPGPPGYPQAPGYPMPYYGKSAKGYGDSNLSQKRRGGGRPSLVQNVAMPARPLLRVEKWELSTGRRVGVLNLNSDAPFPESVSGWAFAPSGRLAVVGTNTGRLYLVNLSLRFQQPESERKPTIKRPATKRPGAKPVRAQPKPASKTPRPDRKRPSPASQLSGEHQGQVTAVAVLPDSNTILTAGLDGCLVFWDARSGKQSRRVADAHVARDPQDTADQQHPITQILVSADGRKALTLAPNALLRTWDLHTGQPLVTLERPGACLSMSADGALAVSLAGKDLVLWDLTKGLEVARMVLDGDGRAVAFLPDGAHLVTVTNKSLQHWQLRADLRGRPLSQILPADPGLAAREESQKRDAAMHLDLAKKLLESNEDKAKERLQEMLWKFPNTPAAEEAQRILDDLDE